MVVHACNPSNQETDVIEWRVQGQPRLHSKTPSQKINLKNSIKRK
jgi:hypothetical protein